MTDLATLSAPKQMKTIITLLNLVKSELFITIDHAERCLEMFISERQSNASLQQFIQALQQIRGSLKLIEISGAAKLTDIMLEHALAIPVDADQQWDSTLTALSTSIFTLRRYLENFESYPYPLPELLIPTINELNLVNKQPVLPDSYFAEIRVTHPPLPNSLPDNMDVELFNRLRQMYQIGLLGLIKDENREASLRMMSRSMDRLQKHLDNEDAARLCWVASAALESFTDSKMTAFQTRKRLFSRVDQQLRKVSIDKEAVSDSLLKDLLYMISLDDSLGMKALMVFGAFNLSPLAYTNKVLESEIAKLAGPSQRAICSFTAAVREELLQTKNTINSFTDKSTDHKSLVESLLNNLKHLIKTLSLVGIQAAETMLKEQVGILELNKNQETLAPNILDKLADVVLHIEGIIINYETNVSCDTDEKSIASDAETLEDNMNQFLKRGRSLAIQESLVGISTAQQNIMGYIESQGDKQYLEKMPQILNEIFGCLLFLNQDRAAKIIRQCSFYIKNQMINTNALPDTKQLDNLADILTSLEFFIETSTLNSITVDHKVLDLAEESLETLDMPSVELPKSSVEVSESIIQTASMTTESDIIESISPTTIEPIKKSGMLFADTNTPNATIDLKEPKDLDFSSNNLSSPPHDIELAKSPPIEEVTLELTPSIESSTIMTDDLLFDSKDETHHDTPVKLELEPTHNEEKTNITPHPTKKPESKDDDDDIKFTRPENWTLS